jgi:hypothetical protein
MPEETAHTKQPPTDQEARGLCPRAFSREAANNI